MWRFVQNKGNQRWLWHAIDHASGKVLAYVFGARKDKVFNQLESLLKAFGIRHSALSIFIQMIGARIKENCLSHSIRLVNEILKKLNENT